VARGRLVGKTELGKSIWQPIRMLQRIVILLQSALMLQRIVIVLLSVLMLLHKVLGFTLPLAKMSTRSREIIFLGSKATAGAQG
jgi:hypothetical protein